jgi:hypothetical protein
VRRQHAGFAPGLGGSEQEYPQHRACRQGFDVRRLTVGGDDTFEFPPKLIHRTELRRLLRQPDEFDVQARGQRLRRRSGVRARAIEQQPDRARSSVASPQFEKERPRIGPTRLLPFEDDAVRRMDVDRAEEHPFRVLPGDGHDSRPSDGGPRRPQRWKESQERPIGNQHYIAGPKARSQATAESPFFCAR